MAPSPRAGSPTGGCQEPFAGGRPGALCSCRAVTWMGVNGKRRQARAWLPAWAICHPLGILDAGALRELVSWAMGRRPNEEWDRLWETAPRARVLQELGDLGGSDFPLESHGRGNLAGNTPRGAAGGHPPACWPAPPAAAGAPGPAARAAPGGPSAGAPCPRSPPRRPARGPRSGNGTSTLAGSGCRRLRQTGRISAST